ncbi:MAG: hypothetical protein ABIR17_11620 [Pseudolysinimonas sp.]
MELGNSFTVRHARAAGFGSGALRSPRLAAPFHGVRSRVEPVDVVGWCRAYSAKMRPDAAFASLTAAQLWGAPVPAAAMRVGVDVVTPHDTARVLGRGVRGTQYADGTVEIVDHEGFRILSPASTWVDLVGVLDFADLVAVGDFFVTPPFGRTDARATREELARALALCRRVGAPRLRAALDIVRVGPLSRPESHVRVLAVSAGLPEPVPNLRVSPLLMFDLAWPGCRLGLDYQGAGHRSATQYARDLGRVELARREGWELVQIAKADLYEHPFDLVGRLRSRLVDRGATVRVVQASKVVLPRP